jgi:hypothetical protein
LPEIRWPLALAVAFSKYLFTSSNGAFASLPDFDYVQWINHLQRAILTNHLFRLAPQRLYLLYANRKSAVWCRGSHSQAQFSVGGHIRHSGPE